MHHFNMYDKNWNFVDDFWSAGAWGVKEIGGFFIYETSVGRKYYIKRMS